MTEEQYQEKLRQDMYSIAHDLTDKQRAAFIRCVNEALINFRRKHQIPRNVMPVIRWDAHKKEFEVYSITEFAELCKKRNAERTARQKSVQQYAQYGAFGVAELSDSYNKMITHIYRAAGSCSCSVDRVSGSQIYYEAPTAEAADRFIKMCQDFNI
jgi:hypothetical protein